TNENPIGTENITEIEHNLIKQSKYLVKTNHSLSTPELYDKGLMEILIQNGWLDTLSQKYKSLIDIFEKHLNWDPKSSKWKV
ncbi:MAG: hypothetical protein ACI37T_03880, partial [Candidatus Gastranaerophilaceae bacterium]